MSDPRAVRRTVRGGAAARRRASRPPPTRPGAHPSSSSDPAHSYNHAVHVIRLRVHLLQKKLQAAEMRARSSSLYLCPGYHSKACNGRYDVSVPGVCQ